MAVPHHIKVVFRGVVLDTPEIWSISLKYKREFTGAPDLDPSDIHADGILAAGTTYFHNARFDTRLRWEEWRAYHIGSDGLMVGNPRVEPLASSSFQSGTGEQKYPPQVAICVTTVATERGPARYGRWFMPCVATPFGGDSRLIASDALSLANAASTFAKDVSGALDIVNDQRNTPLVNISNIGTGTMQEVDHIEVGRVLDTQRRRRNALVEERVSTGHIDW